MIFIRLQIIFLFLIIFALPLYLQYTNEGAKLAGNIYVQKYAYINGLVESSFHLYDNILIYISLYTNPLLYFFIVALIFQKFIFWLLSND